MAKRKRRSPKPEAVDQMIRSFESVAQAVAAAGPALRRLMATGKPRAARKAIRLAAELAERFARHSETFAALQAGIAELRRDIAESDARSDALKATNRELRERLARYESDDPPLSGPRFDFSRN